MTQTLKTNFVGKPTTAQGQPLGDKRPLKEDLVQISSLL
jgi:hypothetical protein